MPRTPPSGIRAGFIICVLALLSIFPPLATDMYLSAMADLAKALDAPRATVELSLSIFFLGLCVGQVLTGPLVDTFGRKPVLVCGTLIYTLTSLALLLVRDAELFNGLRFVQAIGACVGMVVGRAVVSDLYEGRKAAQIMTILVMLMTLGPILSPFLGSLLLTLFGWQSIFITLVGVGVLALCLVLLFVPETMPSSNRKRGAFKASVAEFGKLAVRPVFVFPALVAAAIQASMFAFITASSGVFQGAFGLTSLSYGVLFGGIASALVIFGQINRLLLTRFDPGQILSVGLPVSVLTAAALVAFSGSGTLWCVVIPLWLSVGMIGLLSANAMSVAMERCPGAAGVGSAWIGMVQFGVAFGISSLVAFLGTDRAAPMALAMLGCALVGCALWGWIYRQESGHQGVTLNGH